MSFWTELIQGFRGTTTPGGAQPEGSPEAAAVREMRQWNPNVLWGMENGRYVFIEDHADPDGRMFRLEYQCDPQGKAAVVYCRYNPWRNNPYDYSTSHLREDGFLCIGAGIHAERSPYDLSYAVQRARFWCTAYSYLREQGRWPDV